MKILISPTNYEFQRITNIRNYGTIDMTDLEKGPIQNPSPEKEYEKLKTGLDTGSESLIGESHERKEDKILIDKEYLIFAICDGMGGHFAGDKAADITIEYIKNRFKEIPQEISPENITEIEEQLGNIINDANKKVYDYWIENEDDLRNNPNEHGKYDGMGATLAAVKFLVSKDGKIIPLVVTVGDTPVFHFSGKKLQQVSDLDENSRGHLTQNLGQKERIKPHVYVLNDFKPGDKIVIASDGVADKYVLKNPDIERILKENADDSNENIVNKIIKEAQEADKKEDDMSVIVVGFSEADAERKTDTGQIEIEDENNGEGHKPAQTDDKKAEKKPVLEEKLERAKEEIKNLRQQFKKSKDEESSLIAKQIIDLAKEIKKLEAETEANPSDVADVEADTEKQPTPKEKLKEELQRAQEKFENIKKELIDIIEKCKTNYNGKIFKEKTILEVGDKKVEFEEGDNIIENFNLSDYIDLIKKYENDVELYKNHDQIEEEINSLIGQSILLSEHKNILKELMKKIDEALKLQEAEEVVADIYEAEDEKILQEINTLRQEMGVEPIESVGKIDATDRTFYELVKTNEDNEEKLKELKENYKNNIKVTPETPPIAETSRTEMPLAVAEPTVEPAGPSVPTAETETPPVEAANHLCFEILEIIERAKRIDEALGRDKGKTKELIENNEAVARINNEINELREKVERETSIDALERLKKEVLEKLLELEKEKTSLAKLGKKMETREFVEKIVEKVIGKPAEVVGKTGKAVGKVGGRAALYGLAYGATFFGLLVKNSFKLAWAELKVIWGAVSEHIPGGKDFSKGWEIGRKTFAGKEEKSEKK